MKSFTGLVKNELVKIRSQRKYIVLPIITIICIVGAILIGQIPQINLEIFYAKLPVHSVVGSLLSVFADSGFYVGGGSYFWRRRTWRIAYILCSAC